MQGLRYEDFFIAPLEEYVNKRIESGLYNSPDEVVREALHLMQEKDQWLECKAQLGELLIKRLAEVGEAPIPAEDVRHNILKTLKQTQRKHHLDLDKDAIL